MSLCFDFGLLQILIIITLKLNWKQETNYFAIDTFTSHRFFRIFVVFVTEQSADDKSVSACAFDELFEDSQHLSGLMDVTGIAGKQEVLFL